MNISPVKYLFNYNFEWLIRILEYGSIVIYLSCHLLLKFGLLTFIIIINNILHIEYTIGCLSWSYIIWPHCIFLRFWCSCCAQSLTGVYLSVTPRTIDPPASSCPWNFSGKHTGVGCHFLPPGDLPNLGIKLHLLHCQ